ncbi:hypothetical protein SAMN03159341_103376 [Paenibacillus sp. 1_12]|uniref:hypothetical protein n=1 Tax=Paenibacillus sp. 1_12 TaxID=1566278 RepID=UPI0008F22E20|nr:hypothetical protein [Paenibacillus sp. 1_12]SFL12814.1 hypothetical protein SAMN03159341_103376 [Paenibacillus sp. 1_12]
MQITIEDNSLMYIYLKSKDNHEKLGKCVSDVKCFLLYDIQENIVGFKLINTRDNTDISLNGIPLIETIKLPTVGYIDTPQHNASITESENEILIMFDEKAVIYQVREDECNIDLCKEGILGIEPTPFTYIGGKEIIKPFIIEDIPLTLTKLE